MGRRTHQGPWRTAVITGASSGIGEALAAELAQRGVSVGLLARRETVLRDLSKRLEEMAPTGRFPVRVADATDEAALIAALDQLWEDLEGVDLFIANAGTGLLTPVLSTDRELTVRDLLRLNVIGSIVALEHMKNRMLGQGHGHLAGVSSLIDGRGLPARSAYCATKAALTTYLESLAAGLDRVRFPVSVIRPGYVRNARNREDAPLMLEPDQAARLIVRGLERRRFEIAFPAPSAVLLGLLNRLPRPLYFGLARWGSARGLARDLLSPSGE